MPRRSSRARSAPPCWPWTHRHGDRAAAGHSQDPRRVFQERTDIVQCVDVVLHSVWNRSAGFLPFKGKDTTAWMQEVGNAGAVAEDGMGVQSRRTHPPHPHPSLPLRGRVSADQKPHEYEALGTAPCKAIRGMRRLRYNPGHASALTVNPIHAARQLTLYFRAIRGQPLRRR